MRLPVTDARQSGEHARLGGGFRRLAETIFFSKFAKAGRFRPRPRRARSPELRPRYHVVCLTRAVLAVTAGVLLFGLTDQLPAKESPTADASPTPKSPVDQLIPWLLDEQKELRGIAFSEVIFDTTGKRVLAVDQSNDVDT